MSVLRVAAREPPVSEGEPLVAQIRAVGLRVLAYTVMIPRVRKCSRNEAST
jgi:hypothetical protein